METPPVGTAATGDSEPRANRLFFLAQTPEEGEPQLAGPDALHARKVLRVAVGDSLSGMDGRGRAWPLRVTSVDRRGVSVAASGPPILHARPGSPGASLPWIEVAVAWPKSSRAESMVSGLVQLGAAALRPLTAERCAALDSSRAERRKERTLRVAREACKQSRNSWLPTFESPTEVSDLDVDARTALLDPRATRGLTAWAREQASAWTSRADNRPSSPLRLAVGPEGGWTDAELASLSQRGAVPVRLSPHVLRIENAAQAALAVLVAACLE